MKSTWMKGIAAMAFGLSILAASGSAQASISYNLTDLGALSQAYFGSSYSTATNNPYNRAFGINDSGTVVGVLKGKFGGASQTHVISWNGTTVTDIGMQPLAPTYTSTIAYGYGINSSGQIVGYTQYNSAYYAFLYNPATNSSTYLGKPSGSVQATATAINDSGEVIGYAGNQSGPNAINTAFIYNAGTIKYIPGATVAPAAGQPVTGSSSATSINKYGLVTGYSTVTGNIARAFIYNSNDSSIGAFQSLGTLGGLSTSTSYGTDINDSGNVVGYSTDANGVQHAFLYTKADGTMIDLGKLLNAGTTSQANAINNNGVVVGTFNSGTTANPINHAFVYSSGDIFDLNSLIDPALGFTLTSATDINNLGQIVGYGTYNGQERAFELTLNSVPTPIPPAAFLFGSGLVGLGYFRSRAKQV